MVSRAAVWVDRRNVTQSIINEEHLDHALVRALAIVRYRLFVATADLKDLHVPQAGGAAVSLFELFVRLAEGGVDVRILHSGVPSGPLLERLKNGVPPGMTLRRCPRVHVKAIIVDGRAMYLGSANLTGAGIGAKSRWRRNFEAGIWTEDLTVIDRVADMLDDVWDGRECRSCGRKKHCPEPLEEPDLASS